MGKSLGFKQGLKSRHVNFIALGGIIGSSYFLGTGYVLNQIGPSAFLAYALGGLITYLTMVCLAELCVHIKGHGSFITYAHQLVSPSFACGVGWSYWINWIVYIPSECIAAGIIIHNYLPQLPIYSWALFFGLVITIINLFHVKAFGEMEFWLSIIKMVLLIGFSLLAVVIFFNVFGTPKQHIGDTFLLKEGGIFPNGYAIFFINMVILLSNFQGSEIIGLAAAESENPQKNIPSALTKVSYRIICLYLIPTFLLSLIFSWKEANLSGSVFAAALDKYGFTKIAHIFNFLIIAGALSCANSGLYAAIRSLHALCHKKLGPSYLTKLNKDGVPFRATLVSLAGIWIMIIVAYFFSAGKVYANLLALSGFTGSICWISICWCQLRYRKKHPEKYVGREGHKFHMHAFPYLTLFAIWIQLFCLGIVVFSPQLCASFYFGVPAVILPIIIYYFYEKRMKKKKALG